MNDDPGSVEYGIVRLELHLPGAQSLKAKRALLNKTRAALRNTLDVSVAEVGFRDSWQRAALGIATVAGEADGVDRVIDRIRAVAERDPRVVVTGIATELGGLDADELDATAGLLAHGSPDVPSTVPSPGDVGAQ